MEAVHLGYHYVRNGEAPGPNCPPERLRSQIRTLKDNGFEIMTCGAVAERMIEGKSLPEKHATLSFDDGLRDQIKTVAPILKQESVPGTFFYVTCALDSVLPPVVGFQILINKLGSERMRYEVLPKAFAGTPYLDILDPKRYDATDRKVGEVEEMRVIKWMFNHWPSQSFKREKLDEMFAEYIGEGSQAELAKKWFINEQELLQLDQSGMEVASHTVTHPALDVTGISEIEEELKKSKDKLSNIIGRPVETFAWTFGGKFRPAAMKLAAESYKSAWNFYGNMSQVSNGTYNNQYDIPRLIENSFLPDSTQIPILPIK